MIETARDPGVVKGPDGTYYLFATGEGGEWGIVRYESTDLRNWSNRTLAWKPFTGRCQIICYHDNMNGIRNDFHSQKTQHHDYLYRTGGDGIHKVDGRVVAYFEGFDGKDWSLGVCCAEE